MLFKRLYATSGFKRYLGRPTNNLTSGIVGLANVGKSTFFQAITNSKLGNPANYPFATIEPEEAKVIVPSSRLQHLKDLYQSSKLIPATHTIYDIAGLTRGASKGEGLGNKFLNDIRHVDGVYQVVRGFSKQEITHIEGSVDPVRDLSIVQDELVLKDLEFLEGIREKLERKMDRCGKNSPEYAQMSAELAFLNSLEEHMYEGKKIAHFKDSWSEEEVSILNKHNFLTAKPTLILLNVSPEDYLMRQNAFIHDIEQWLNDYSPGDELILFSAEYETRYNNFMVTADESGLHEYCKGLVGDLTNTTIDSALPSIILKMRDALGLISFFTCGPLEVRQWTLRSGSTAPQAAGVIHSDLEKTFISANVIKYADLQQTEPPLQESHLKAQGKIKRGGKQYLMQDGDIVLFKAARGNTR
ncbi:LAFE_0H14862g1_1 [Lachancea fermentati]|uniref:Obg-like ATPase homolog n=1 Tax=Lachancea fermentati TaxID=4955 RepID=A0A1G4MKY4_LACFM|nr:LAFE_0H14862g1_1 [Lachancea fermentati]